jgi:hypothetical protein
MKSNQYADPIIWILISFFVYLIIGKLISITFEFGKIAIEVLISLIIGRVILKLIYNLI